ncbi:MAG TPA: phage baseplate assembly protein V [Acidimicrobiales bacterium]|nr:phage baseplate assembly protein V [Acidimicrobiales bacterium]
MADTITLSPQVKVNGAPLATTWQGALLELRVEHALNVPARVTLRFADPGYALLTSNSVSLDDPLEVGGPGGSPTLFTGTVTGVGSEQREGEQPELVLVGHDKSYKLGLTSRVKTWTEDTISNMVSSLLTTESTLSASWSGTTQKLDYLLQVDTDLGLLGELTRREGADWVVKGSTVHIGKPDELAGTMGTVSLTLGDDLLSFSARATPAPEQVSVSGWDNVAQQTVTGASSSASSGISPSSTLAGLATGSATFVTAAVGARSSSEATTLSQAIFDLRAAAAVEATGTAVGNGGLAPGAKVTISGAGPLSGTYPVTAVEHVYRPRRGFITRFRSGDRRPAGLADSRSANGFGPAGSVVGHYGVTAGIVTNIKDPEKIGRVKLRFPGMSSTQESAWARVVAMGGGSSRGNVFLPEVDDEVLVAFEDGDTRVPVVIGGLYGKSLTMPTITVTEGKVVKRELVSRLGHTVRFLDGTQTKDMAIELALADGANIVHLGADKTTVTVKQGNELTFTVGQTTITVASGTGALSIKAGTIKIQATQQLELTAPKIVISSDGTLTLEAQAMTKLAGASVQVQAEAVVTISGTPVSINGG